MKVTHPESRDFPCAHGIPIFDITIYTHTHMFSNYKKKNQGIIFGHILFTRIWIWIFTHCCKMVPNNLWSTSSTHPILHKTLSCKAMFSILSVLRSLPHQCRMCLWYTRDSTHPWDATRVAAFCTLHNHYFVVKMKVRVREALRVNFYFICTLANLQRLPG